MCSRYLLLMVRRYRCRVPYIVIDKRVDHLGSPGLEKSGSLRVERKYTRSWRSRDPAWELGTGQVVGFYVPFLVPSRQGRGQFCAPFRFIGSSNLKILLEFQGVRVNGKIIDPASSFVGQRTRDLLVHPYVPGPTTKLLRNSLVRCGFVS